ncbi:MAG: hypothetical protein IJS60_05465 [Abditibacteriota bacterium]|nr:hypothetical protein [Abditibacteriota bacterium]
MKKIIIVFAPVLVIFLSLFFLYKNYLFFVPEEKERIGEIIEDSGNGFNLKTAYIFSFPREKKYISILLKNSNKIDLANYSGFGLISHVRLALKTNFIDKNDPLFLYYVLPNRIASEPTVFERKKTKKIYNDLVIKNKNSDYIAKSIRQSIDDSKYLIGSTNPMDWTPYTAYLHSLTKGWNCRAKSLYLVGMLRTIGIPATLVQVPVWHNLTDDHEYFAYYSIEDKCWYLMDSEMGDPLINEYVKKCQVIHGTSFILGYPPFYYEDVYAKKDFYKLVDFVNNFSYGDSALVTKFSKDVPWAKLTVKCNKPSLVGVYIWRDEIKGYYPANKFELKNKEVSFYLGASNIQGKNYMPYLITCGAGDEIKTKNVSLSKGQYSVLNFEL